MPYVALAHAGRVHYAERGERRPGRPSAVLIHGAGASSAIWMMVLARVARARPRDRDRSARRTAPAPRGRGARRRGRADAGALPRRRRRAGGRRSASARRCWSGIRWARWSRSRRRWRGPTRCAALVLCAAAPRLPVEPELARLLRDEPARRDRVAGRARAIARAPSPPIRRGFLAAGEATPPEVTRADFEIVRATDLGARIGGDRVPGHVARRRRRPHRRRRPKDGRARSSRCPTSAT